MAATTYQRLSSHQPFSSARRSCSSKSYDPAISILSQIDQRFLGHHLLRTVAQVLERELPRCHFVLADDHREACVCRVGFLHLRLERAAAAEHDRASPVAKILGHAECDRRSGLARMRDEYVDIGNGLRARRL